MSAADRTRVLVTGARGHLAGAIIDAFSADTDVVAYAHEDLDIVNAEAVMSRVRNDRPAVIINCASYNEVDAAEDQPEKALSVNAFALRLLARAAVEAGATLVHYSTDFVFDGDTSRPYGEDDQPNPQSVYAQSKLLGEWFAAESPGAFVLRVESLFGGPRARSSVDRMVAAISRGEIVKAFADRIVSPSYVDDVALATKMLLAGGAPGLYHCVNTGFCTWYELAHEIAGLMGKTTTARIVGVSVADVSLRAPRPRFAALANDKLRRVVNMPTWRDALRTYLAQGRTAVSTL